MKLTDLTDPLSVFLVYGFDLFSYPLFFSEEDFCQDDVGMFRTLSRFERRENKRLRQMELRNEPIK